LQLVPWQQPVEQDVCVQVHEPLTHCWPAPQAAAPPH
jgi:hypothetical protein